MIEQKVQISELSINAQLMVEAAKALNEVEHKVVRNFLLSVAIENMVGINGLTE